MSNNNSSKRPADVQVHNNRRAQWFFRFRVDEATAALAEGVVGLKVERGTFVEGGKMLTATLCTLVLGDAEADVERGELNPRLTIPGPVWAALLAEPSQGAAVKGLLANGEISIYAVQQAA